MAEAVSTNQVTLEYFKNLIAIAAADGKLEESEKRFLMAKAKEFNLPTDEVSDFIQHADKIDFVVPKERLNREEHLTDIVIMSMVDGELRKEEYDLCISIAEKLELSPGDVDAIVALIKRSKRKKQEANMSTWQKIISFFKG